MNEIKSIISAYKIKVHWRTKCVLCENMLTLNLIEYVMVVGRSYQTLGIFFVGESRELRFFATELQYRVYNRQSSLAEWGT